MTENADLTLESWIGNLPGSLARLYLFQRGSVVIFYEIAEVVLAGYIPKWLCYHTC